MAAITVHIWPLAEADIIAFHLTGWVDEGGLGSTDVDPSAITITNVRAVMPTAGDHRRLGR